MAGPVRDNATALAALAAVATLVVGSAWHFTREAIADQAARRTLAEITTVLPASRFDNAPHRDVVLLDTGSGEPLPVYRARLGGQPAAAVLTVITLGYAGPVRLLVGIAADGTVLGVHVAAHAETPGIGAVVAEASPAWLTAFAGRSAAAPPPGGWAIRADGGEFDAVAGATTTSRGIVAGVRQAVQYFATHREVILAGHE